jgi:FKBP-type peptidyl-prolyl cis-trans isomerase SlyD
MDTIQNDHVVEINYTLTDESGDVIDSTQKENPFAFIQGKQNLLPGLEMEIQGKKVGEVFKAVIPPEKAYGQHNQSLVQSLPLESFGADAKSIKVGDAFQIQDHNGQVMRVQAVEINDQEITLDANHQLAGKTLTFDVEIISVREATADELAKGHLFTESSCCDSDSCC